MNDLQLLDLDVFFLALGEVLLVDLALVLDFFVGHNQFFEEGESALGSCGFRYRLC